MKKLLGFLVALALIGCASPSYYPVGEHPYFMWPVRKGRITQGFKKRSRKHQGIDIAGQKNTPIYAAESGRVLYVGREFSGYGKLIIIEHGSDKWATFYAHLNRFKVSEGQRVRKGQIIGLMGRTGRATGVHLHFEIRYRLSPINPLQYLSRPQSLTKR